MFYSKQLSLYPIRVFVVFCLVGLSLSLMRVCLAADTAPAPLNTAPATRNAPPIAPDAPPGAAANIQAPLEVIRTDHFEISYGAELRGVVDKLGQWLENVHGWVEESLQYVPLNAVRVVLCTNEQQYHDAGGYGDPVAGCVSRDAIVILPDPTQAQGLGDSLTRLYVRRAVGKITGGRAAVWLSEGVEHYLAGNFTGCLDTIARSSQENMMLPLGSGIKGETAGADAVFTQGPLEAGGSLAPDAIWRAESVFAIYFLQHNNGEQTLSKLLARIGAGDSWDAALKNAAGMDGAAFEKKWMDSAHSSVRGFTGPGEREDTWSTPKHLVPTIPLPPPAGQAALVRVVVGGYSLPVGDQVDALLVTGGNVIVQGTVTSRIGVLGGSLRLASTCRAHGKITVIGGTLTVDRGAIVDAAADVSSTGWKPENIQSEQANLAVTLNRPIDVNLRLPGRSYWMQEGSLVVAPNDTLDAAVALGGGVDVQGAVSGRVVAIGGNVNFAGNPSKTLPVVSVGGIVLAKGQPLDPKTYPQVIEFPRFEAQFNVPVQAGDDPVPVFLGMGDCAIPGDQFYDAILCAGGECQVDGEILGGLVVGGNVQIHKGAKARGHLWVYGGRVDHQEGADIKGLDIRGDAAHR